MKKLFFIMLAALIGLSCYAQKNEKVLYSLTPNMNCQNCVNRVQQALTAIEGVSSVKPDLATQTVEVVYNPTTLKPEIIVNALTAIGYTAKQTTLEEASRAMKRVIDANPGIVTAIDGKPTVHQCADGQCEKEVAEKDTQAAKAQVKKDVRKATKAECNGKQTTRKECEKVEDNCPKAAKESIAIGCTNAESNCTEAPAKATKATKAKKIQKKR